MRASNVSEQRFRRERVSSKRQFSCPFPFFFLPPLCLGALCVCRWPNKKGKQSRGSIPLCCSYAVLIPLFLYIYFFSGVLSTALEEPVLTNLLFLCVCFLTSKPEALPTSRQWNGNHTTDVASFRMMSPFFIIIFAVVAAFFFFFPLLHYRWFPVLVSRSPPSQLLAFVFCWISMTSSRPHLSSSTCLKRLPQRLHYCVVSLLFIKQHSR